jgi:DNA-directed RNA polymerase subunit H
VVEGSNPFKPVWCYLEPVCCSFFRGGKLSKFAVKDHDLVPEHALLTPEEAEEVLKGYGIEAPQLPKIHVNDPAAKEIGAKVGDVVRILRRSPTAKQSVFYRLVID